MIFEQGQAVYENERMLLEVLIRRRDDAAIRVRLQFPLDQYKFIDGNTDDERAGKVRAAVGEKVLKEWKDSVLALMAENGEAKAEQVH